VQEDSIGVKTVLIDVPMNKWSYSNLDSNNYFFCSIDMPELTADVCRNGLVKMYRVYDDTSDMQIELPYIRHNEYQRQGNDWGFYTETVDYEFGRGYMRIVYTANDFDYELDETFIPEAMTFRCVIMY